MDVASIPRMQSQRVALYEQQFGTFDSGKNAYWSLRRGTPVTLAEGARFDADMRAGRLAPAGTLRVVRGVSTMPSKTGAGTYRAVSARTPKMFRMDLAPMPAGPRRRSIAPQERMSVMPTEAIRYDMLPASPPPGPAQPPKEPLFDAVMRQLREQQAGPATATIATRPDFAAPGRAFATAAPGVAVAGFDMKKLALPLALVAGAFVVSKLV